MLGETFGVRTIHVFLKEFSPYLGSGRVNSDHEIGATSGRSGTNKKGERTRTVLSGGHF
jgi:hypothetical protein